MAKNRRKNVQRARSRMALNLEEDPVTLLNFWSFQVLLQNSFGRSSQAFIKIKRYLPNRAIKSSSTTFGTTALKIHEENLAKTRKYL